jgi:hypothetical protein
VNALAAIGRRAEARAVRGSWRAAPVMAFSPSTSTFAPASVGNFVQTYSMVG